MINDLLQVVDEISQQHLLKRLSLIHCISINLLYVSMDLPVWDISYKWTCTYLSQLVPFTEHNVFKFHPHCNI